MGSKPTKVWTNGSGRRKCQSWVESFVELTANLGTAEIFRKWTAITTIAAALEQRVWLTTSGRLYPNLYTILVGHPGVGKTRTIMSGRRFLAELDGFNIAPTSMKMASLVDALYAAKRTTQPDLRLKTQPEEYHSMVVIADDWSGFMHVYDEELVGGLTIFYDCHPYVHHRRGKEIRIAIERPQLTVLAGATPTGLIRFMPEKVWDEGFASRTIFVYSDEKYIVDDFAIPPPDDKLFEDLLYDMQVIFRLHGQFKVTPEYIALVNEWKANGEKPKPTHPKLRSYCGRRYVDLYKLGMVCAVDRGNDLQLDSNVFRDSLYLLNEVEANMNALFEAGTTTVDFRVMDEIEETIRAYGKPMPETRLFHEACKRVPAANVNRVLELMKLSGRITMDEKGWTTPPPHS